MAPTAVTLVGPPEIYTLKSTPTTTTVVPTQTPVTTTADAVPSLAQILGDFNSLSATYQMDDSTYDESPFDSTVTTGNPCLDFFYFLVPNEPSQTLVQRLEQAWSHDPLTTLKLVFNLRGVQGTGKSDREAFYNAALWLHKHHPKTLASNIPSLAAHFGCFKDLPEILYRLLEGSSVRKTQKEDWKQKKFQSRNNRSSPSTPLSAEGQCATKTNKKQRKGWKYTEKDSLMSEETAARAKAQKETAHALKEEKRIALAKKLVQRYTTDPNFKFLHDSISDHFADCLKKDLQFLNSGSSTKISLAAKWCPSVDSSFDRSTLLCESIAKRVFPKEEYEGVEEAHYAYRVRDRLRKDVLVPLRKVLELPEVLMSANQWGLIPYDRVASVAMNFYEKKFLKHDKERFEKYLEDVKAGRTTIAAGNLLAHDVESSRVGGVVQELQWKRMVDDLLKKGKMRNCLAVCDVSRNMTGTPLEVAVALGLLVSELSDEPWKGKVITFSAKPHLHLIQGDDLKSKTESLRNMDWGRYADLQKVFDCILDVAVNANLKDDQMIKKIFVFSNMAFPYISSEETVYQAITTKFVEKGYGSAVPQIVFWNLGDSYYTPVPVQATQKGVALVSGYSKNLLTLFLDNEGDISPVEAMEAAIAGPEYQKLVVLD